MLDISPLSDGQIAKKFFSFCWLPVPSNDSFFCHAEAVEFDQVPFVYFGICCNCFWCFSHEVLNGIAQVFFQGFYGVRSYVKSLIHLELIFFIGVRKESSFSFLHMASHFSQHHLFNRESFFHCFCQVGQRSYGFRYVVLPPRPLFCSIGL